MKMVKLASLINHKLLNAYQHNIYTYEVHLYM